MQRKVFSGVARPSNIFADSACAKTFYHEAFIHCICSFLSRVRGEVSKIYKKIPRIYFTLPH